VFTVTRDGRTLLRETWAIRNRVTGLRGPATRRSGQV
jgi:hypothetical protein